MSAKYLMKLSLNLKHHVETVMYIMTIVANIHFRFKHFSK